MTSCAKILCFIVATGLSLSPVFAGQIVLDADTSAEQITQQTESVPMSDSDLDISSQFPGDWRITLIGTEVIAPELGITMTLDIGTAQFFTGCNTANATHNFAVGNSGFDITGVTKKACSPEIMTQETALLDAISKIEVMNVIAGTALGFYDMNNQLIMAATKADP